MIKKINTNKEDCPQNSTNIKIREKYNKRQARKSSKPFDRAPTKPCAPRTHSALFLIVI